MVGWCGTSLSSFRAVLCENWKSSLRRRFSLHRRVKLSLPAANLIVSRITLTDSMQIETAMESLQNDQTTPAATPPMSKNAQKRLLKQQRYEAKKAEKKAQMKEHKKREAERKRKEWQEKLANVGEEEREKLIEERKGLRKERMEKRSEERGKKIERLQEARINGRNVVIDLEFAHLMNSTELNSLVQQVPFFLFLFSILYLGFFVYHLSLKNSFFNGFP